eukprot:404340-Prorocentrum_minimum.AAC.1
MDTTPDVPFGGKVVVFAGDQRQTCVIVKGASRAQLVDATLPNSQLWQHFRVMHLTENVRIQRALAADASSQPEDMQAARDFGDWLLALAAWQWDTASRAG